MNDTVAKMTAELRALPEQERESLIDDLIINPDLLCGIVFFPTSLEQDIQTIMNRVRINATIVPSSGSVINEGEDFIVNVNVRNCAGHDLRDVTLRATGTTFAKVKSPISVSLGNMGSRTAATATFQCEAIKETPAGNPPDTLINLSANGIVDLRGLRRRSVQGEVFPD